MTSTLRGRPVLVAAVTAAAALVVLLGGVLAATQGPAVGAPGVATAAKPRPPRPSGSATQPPVPTPSPTASSASPTPTPTTSTAATPYPLPSPTPTASPNSPSTQTACSTTPVQFAGAGYCPAQLSYVRATAYGLGQRVVLQTVHVIAVNGRTVTVQGGSPCYPAGTFCGATLVAAPVVFPPDVALPVYGDFVNVYGVTTAGGLEASAQEFLFWCDPTWAC